MLDGYRLDFWWLEVLASAWFCCQKESYLVEIIVQPVLEEDANTVDRMVIGECLLTSTIACRSGIQVIYVDQRTTQD